MHDRDTKASIIKYAKTVSATVTACVTILLILQPWRGAGDSPTANELPTGSIAASVETAPAAGTASAVTVRTKSQDVEGGVTASEETPAVTKDTASAGSRDSNDDPSRGEGSEIRLAARSPSPSSVPLPEKDPPLKQEADGPIPMPVQREALNIDEAVRKASLKIMPGVGNQFSKAQAGEALEPLLAYQAPDSDVEKLKTFVKLTYRQKFSESRPLMESMSDPVAKKYARWYYYRKKAPDTTAQEIQAFLDENPRWPSRDALEESAEDALFWREQDPQRVIDFFGGRRPVSGVGLAALGKALIETGNKEGGAKFVRDAWRNDPLTHAIEKKLRKLRVLDKDDHRRRADYLLMQDNRRYISAVKRLLPQIEKKWKPSVKARIATVQRAGNAGTLLTRLDKEIKLEPPVLFARIQWLRRADNDEKVWRLLKSAPNSAEELVDPTEWWDEREIQVRLAIYRDKPEIAYEIAKNHGEGLEHWDLSEAEFVAGWIALRFLNKREAARDHFRTAAAAGGLPKRRARAAYWLGRTELELGDQTAAIARFAEAAQHHHTFYGQLAHQMIAATDAKVAFRNFVRPSEAEIEDFVEQDVMKAIVLSHQADFENLMSLFLYDRARTIESAPEMVLLCELAARVAPPHRAVRMAKIAMNRDFPVEHYAYPNALPEFRTLAEGQSIENALLHALTRQESEFNPTIVSSAGAVGLMQLLPSTAKMVARRHGQQYSKRNLSADPAYNVSLGTAFLHRLVGNYDGSYIMALAGYNAGPGRIRRWVKQFGDPRDSDVDPIDWIERIPFKETRNYVHKILESAQVYRTRLLGSDAPLRLAEDLHRGRKDKPKFLAATAAN